MTDLSALISLAESATPGPWKTDWWYVVAEVPGGRPGGEVIITAGMTVNGDPYNNEARRKLNAEYVAALSPSVALSLLRELAAARKVVEDAGWFLVLHGEPSAQRKSLVASLAAYDASTTKTEAEGT